MGPAYTALPVVQGRLFRGVASGFPGLRVKKIREYHNSITQVIPHQRK